MLVGSGVSFKEIQQIPDYFDKKKFEDLQYLSSIDNDIKTLVENFSEHEKFFINMLTSKKPLEMKIPV